MTRKTDSGTAPYVFPFNYFMSAGVTPKAYLGTSSVYLERINSLNMLLSKNMASWQARENYQGRVNMNNR